ncbi:MULTISPECIES: hypothetical protein [Streptomyces]|uniref:hypothetical protein n=1 Tax=Streptomyces TaxID=1883 RepID=UPI00069B2B58|nr:hypothetical protein [Streptomyces sp. SID7805]MYU55050.1 hypothetical protein [Streptomyces sp. SID7805]
MAYKDRQGLPIDVAEWARLRRDTAYCVVDQDKVDNVMVRTVWEGIEDVVGGAMFATGISRDAGKTWRTLREDALAEDGALVQHSEVVQMVRRGEASGISAPATGAE